MGGKFLVVFDLKIIQGKRKEGSRFFIKQLLVPGLFLRFFSFQGL